MSKKETLETLPRLVIMEQAALYARVSGDDRKYATSGIEGQLNDCRKYAQERNYRIVGEYYEAPDKQTSGYHWLPELEKILKLAEQGGFDVLVVREVDRLARNRFKQMSVENRLEALGIRVEYVIGQYENTSEGRLLKGLMSEFAEYERNKIQERMERGRMRALKAGKVVAGGYAPYGYKIKDNHFVIEEGEAEIVRLIFDLYVFKGYSISGITAYLNEHNIPHAAKKGMHNARVNQKKPREWTRSTIENFLSNQSYIGKWYYGKNQVIRKPDGKKKYVPRPKKEWLLVEIPAIIDDSIFAVAQAQKAENKRLKGRNRKFTYLFGGMLQCGHCGKSVSGITSTRNGKAWSYYGCNARRAPRVYGFKCQESAYFRVEDVDDTLWDWISSILMDEEYLNKALNQYQTEQLKAQQPIVKLIEANQAKLDELEAQKNKLIEGYTLGLFTLNDIAPKKVDLDDQILKLREGIEALQGELSPATLSQDQINEIRAFAAKVRKGLIAADKNFEAKRKIVTLLQTQVTLTLIDGQKWAEIKCMLGNKKLLTESISTGEYRRQVICGAIVRIDACRSPAGLIFGRALFVYQKGGQRTDM